MAASLARPGVEVVQEFRATTPTVITPTLVPCVVGVAKQIVEVLTSSGSGNVLNPDALITLPAAFLAKAATGNPPKYTGLNTLILAFSVNNGVPIEVTFADALAAGLTPADVVTQVNARLEALLVSSVIAETVGETQWRLRTIGVGEFQSIVITTPTANAVASAFGIGINRTSFGLTSYNQYEIDIPIHSFPDPRGNLEELALQTETIRVFLGVDAGGSGLQELKRNESFLRSGVVDDAAQKVGNVTLAGLTYPGGVQSGVLNLKVDNGDLQTHTIASNPANAAALIAELDANFDGVDFSNVGGFLAVTSLTTGASSKIEILAGSLATTVGLSVGSDVGESIAAVDDGNGDILTPILEFDEENFAATPTVAVLTASQAPTTPGANTTLIISDGKQPQTVVFAGTESNIGLIVTAINAVIAPAAGGHITASDSGGSLRLTHDDFGNESMIKIIGGTALSALDGGGTPTIVAGATVRGVAFKPLPGDRLYIDGVFYANIVQVAPAGVNTRLKIDRQVAISTDVGSRFYIQAVNLPLGGSSTRPYPDLAVDSLGNVVMKHSVLRDPFGDVINVKAPVYLSYTAVRQDVSPLAVNKGLLKFDSTTSLSAALEPISAANPLALGLFFALVNAPGAEVTGLGVDAISADAPFGTIEAFTRAAEFLEASEVYALAPLTHDETVGQVFNTHATFMSEPANKGERIALWNPTVPTRKLDTLVVSGTDGDALTTTTFDTKAASLTTKVNNAGVSPIGTIPTSAGLYVDLAGDSKKYSVQSISGSVVTIRTSFAPGDNDDGYYSTSAFVTSQVIAETFAIRVRGAPLTVAGIQDKSAVAETMQALGASFLNRRLWMTFPDQCAATVEGVEQVLDGFYMNAAIAGMIAQQPPQQSFTNFPMTGFTRVIGSQDTFSSRQLDVMAAGGTYIIVQDSPGAPLISRMALTTDMTSIESRTDSITKILDFTAKFLRKGLKNYIGRFNITQGFLDSLGSVIQGMLGYLVENGVLIGANLDNLIQDEDAPDTVIVEIVVDVPFPCNYIRIRLVV